ncbi:hypothetical protein C8F04DRAFT_1183702 [Mycena alexandri]|uniref:Uncharacterized protein n=1 Tax=Mycena alexandri TaxID=1745969 RepID=A0AAD6SX55_9AGAR|nr:hypothetical protein C8F04DRAFT_1183702 [Mycena alexandri]
MLTKSTWKILYTTGESLERPGEEILELDRKMVKMRISESGNSASAAKARVSSTGIGRRAEKTYQKVKRKTDPASSLGAHRPYGPIGPLQRQGSARQVSDGELIEFTKILSMLLVSGEKSLRILGPVWVHGSAAKARGSQEQISPGFCALKSDSEQLRAIYTRRRSKVTPQPQVLNTSSGALLRATERISRPPTTSIQLVLARWAPSHERLTPGEVAPRRNLRRHSVIQQSHQSVAVRDLRPRGAHEPAAEPLVAVEGACAGGRILCCWVLLVGGEARRQRAIYTRDPAIPSQGGQRAINTRGRRREQTRSGESRPLSRPLSRALIQEKNHKSSM